MDIRGFTFYIFLVKYPLILISYSYYLNHQHMLLDICYYDHFEEAVLILEKQQCLKLKCLTMFLLLVETLSADICICENYTCNRPICEYFFNVNSDLIDFLSLCSPELLLRLVGQTCY